MTPIETVLVHAQKLVERGFVKDRECHSAETMDGVLVNFTHEHAYRFTPTAAIFLVAREVQGTRRTPKNIGDQALSLLSEHGYSMRRYRTARRLHEMLATFDRAIASARRSALRERKAVVISLDEARTETKLANRRMLRRRTFP